MTAATTTAPATVLPAPSISRPTNVIPALALRRLALTIRSPRALAIPLLAPLLFALVVAPALGNTLAGPGQHQTYMTFVALAAAGLLIPVNCLFTGLGVLTDRQQGAMRELLVAPIRRASIVLGNLLAALVITTLQVTVLIFAVALRGAHFQTGRQLLWLVASAVGLVVFVYSLAETFAAKITSAEEYTGLVPPIAIVPFFFAGTLYPITSLPGWLASIAKALPLTHAVALFRYGLTTQGGPALHNIWGMSDPTRMALLSLAVVTAYASAALALAIRVFTKSGTS